jgi:hypothetical protein
MDEQPFLPIQLHHRINLTIVLSKYDANDMLCVISTGYESMMLKVGVQNGYN